MDNIQDKMGSTSSAPVAPVAPTAGINVAWRPAFALDQAPLMLKRPYGSTVLDIVASVPNLPQSFMERGEVRINGVEVKRSMWAYTRPKETTVDSHGLSVPLFVTLHLPPAGGGSGGSVAKQIVGLVAAIALTVVTAGIAGGALATGGWFLAGSISAKFLAGAIALGGALLISALTPPPNATTNAKSSNDESKGAASISGNTAEAGGPISCVIGTHKVFPQFLTEPMIEIVDGDEYVEFVGGLNGPHALTDIRVSDAAIESADDIEYELREGWDTDTPITLVTRQAKTSAPQLELSAHTLADDSDIELKHIDNPDIDLPIFHTILSRAKPDHFWLHIVLPEGIYDRATATNVVAVPFRMRIRALGSSTWINLPEFHLSGKYSAMIRYSINLHFDSDSEPETVDAIPATSGFYYAHNNPPQYVDSQVIQPEWKASSNFYKAGSYDYMYKSFTGLSTIAHTFPSAYAIDFYLQSSWFGLGSNVYEVQIKRGCAYLTSSFAKSTYLYSSGLYDFFTYNVRSGGANGGSGGGGGGTLRDPSIVADRGNFADTVYLNRVVSVWDEHPVPKSGFAIIAGRAKNRTLSSLSVIASRYVRDYNSSTGKWDTWVTTSNPAPHYRDVLTGRLNYDPLPADLIADADLINWRSRCEASSYTCDMVVEDFRTGDLLTTIASCGYARPYQSELYGVIQDYDTSPESPVMMFSPRNSSNFRFEMAFASQPNGWIISYTDKSVNYETQQEIVMDPTYENDSSIDLESISYVGLVTSEKVIKRGLFDFAQVKYRPVFYYLDANIDSIICRRGDLVMIAHDVVDDLVGFGRIKSVTKNGSNRITSITLDASVPVLGGVQMHDITDMHDIVNMHAVGRRPGVRIQCNDGSYYTYPIYLPSTNYDGEMSTLPFNGAIPLAYTPLIDALEDTNYQRGSHVVTGNHSELYIRAKVYAIKPENDFKATITLVDEAPELWSDDTGEG